MLFGALRKAEFGLWQLLEGRAVFEMQSFYMLRLLLRKLPKGDGHPVIVLPGFFANDMSTQPMRSLLDDLGYKSHGWGLGPNIFVDSEREEHLRNLLQNVYQQEGRKVTLIGWSLGGIYARELAKLAPDHVRSVITLGSPISGNTKHSNASTLFTALNGVPRLSSNDSPATFSHPPPVPTTSIFSRTDGIVAWEASVQRQVVGMQSENIEVPASHFGIGVNPIVMLALADRLSQPEGQWRPFESSGIKRLMFCDRTKFWNKIANRFFS